GILPLSVRRSGIDLLAVAGHKSLLGPPGVGFLYIAPDLELEPLIYGGTGTQSRSAELPQEMPERFESGTLNTPGIAGLQAGISYLQETGVEAVRNGEKKLVKALSDGLRSIDQVKVYGPERFEQHGGAVSFNCAELDPAEVGYRLDHEFDIMVRVGLHCAPDAHRTIGTFPRGTVRVSPGCFNTVGDIDRLLNAVKEIIS
ncbi:MAG: cysteine desulfurase, partial [Desulfuromonas sp.]